MAFYFAVEILIYLFLFVCEIVMIGINVLQTAMSILDVILLEGEKKAGLSIDNF